MEINWAIVRELWNLLFMGALFVLSAWLMKGRQWWEVMLLTFCLVVVGTLFLSTLISLGALRFTNGP